MILNDFKLNSNQRQTIQSYVDNNSFPQTILIEGKDEETRIEFAKLIANMIVCTGDKQKPCLVCSSCVKCASDSHPDIKFYSGDKPNGVFKVDTCRQIKADAFIIPNDGDKKVYILSESQNMNEAAENALLKILEEPPVFDFFIMTCDSRSAMLPTVLSRATTINLGETRTEFDDNVVLTAKKIAVAICEDSEVSLLEALACLAGDKNNFVSIVKCLKEMFVQCLIKKETENIEIRYKDIVDKVTTKLTVQRIYTVINTIDEFLEMFKNNANYNLLITLMSCKLRVAVGK